LRPVVLTIAGSDCSAGAGIQADLKTIEASGGYAVTVVTAVTAQNSLGIRHVEILPSDSVRAQRDAVFDDYEVAAVKTGMLADERVISAVNAVLEHRRPAWVVCDPVMRSTTGSVLLDDRGVEAFRRTLLTSATLVTPNAGEAAELSGIEVHDLESAKRAARAILDAGARSVLVTGGHLADGCVTDVLVGVDGTTLFEGSRIDAPHTHGTGCILAAGIATKLALGHGLTQAIGLAKDFVSSAIHHGLALGHGDGPADPLFALHRCPGAVEKRSRDVE
jgi:hydroxymethylpyrimidine/phosphomethylpyrimidine kinase